MNNLIRKNFTQIPNALINDSQIHPIARFLFVYLCSKPDDWRFRTKVIESEIGFSKDTRIKYTNELVNKGWISVRQTKDDKGTWGNMEIELNPYPIFSDTDILQLPKNTAAEKHGSGKNPLLNNTDFNNNTNNLNNTEVLSLFESDDMSDADISLKVLKYLNEKKGGKRGFEASAGNLADIRARLKEKKYFFDDFKKVIDFKVLEWGQDEKNRKYLRPETLFASKKFNAYLIQAEEQHINKNSSQNFVESVTTEDDIL